MSPTVKDSYEAVVKLLETMHDQINKTGQWRVSEPELRRNDNLTLPMTGPVMLSRPEQLNRSAPLSINLSGQISKLRHCFAAFVRCSEDGNRSLFMGGTVVESKGQTLKSGAIQLIAGDSSKKLNYVARMVCWPSKLVSLSNEMIQEGEVHVVGTSEHDNEDWKQLRLDDVQAKEKLAATILVILTGIQAIDPNSVWKALFTALVQAGCGISSCGIEGNSATDCDWKLGECLSEYGEWSGGDFSIFLMNASSMSDLQSTKSVFHEMIREMVTNIGSFLFVQKMAGSASLGNGDMSVSGSIPGFKFAQLAVHDWIEDLSINRWIRMVGGQFIISLYDVCERGWNSMYRKGLWVLLTMKPLDMLRDMDGSELSTDSEALKKFENAVSGRNQSSFRICLKCKEDVDTNKRSLIESISDVLNQRSSNSRRTRCGDHFFAIRSLAGLTSCETAISN